MKDELEQFRNKARCRHSQTQAMRLFRSLASKLPSKDLAALSVAWTHATTEPNGAAELDAVCNRIMGKIPTPAADPHTNKDER